MGRAPLGPVRREALKRALGLRGLDLHAYLYNDHHTLAELARRRGLDPLELADRLVAPWQGIDEARRALLRDRTLRILTQGHLAQHMFFHVFHGLHLGESVSELFGMPLAQYQALRAEGLTYAEIMRRGGVPQARFRAGFTRLLEHHRDEGAASSRPRPCRGARTSRGRWRGCRAGSRGRRPASTAATRTARTACCTARTPQAGPPPRASVARTSAASSASAPGCPPRAGCARPRGAGRRTACADPDATSLRRRWLACSSSSS